MQIENNEKIDEDDFSLIEIHYGYRLSEDVRNFLKKYNGEIVDPEDGLEIKYTALTNDRSFTDWFLTIYHTKQIIHQLQFIDYLEDFFEESTLSRDDVEVENLLPIMEVCGGGLNIYIALSGSHKNKLYMVDNGDFGICTVQSTLAELSLKLSA